MNVKHLIRSTVWSILALALVPCLLQGQDARPVVSGTVTDPQGGVVPNAKVVITNIATSVTTEAVTTNAGTYTAPPVNPGTYTVAVTAQGFKQSIRDNIELRMAERRQVDVTLEVGGSTESVTVTAEAPLLATGSASMDSEISSEAIATLPTFGRNPYMLAHLAAGVQYTSIGGASSTQRPFDNMGTQLMSINGGQAMMNEFVLDGAPNMNNADSAIGSYANFTPPTDAVQEFKVQSNLYDAQYGHTGGGVISVSLKSGTNTLHGSAYWYVRNNVLNANTSAATAVGTKLSSYRWNQPGFQVQGPVVIPKVYNGRNKTFFMYSFETIRSSVPRPYNMVVPTALQRQGDFTQTYVSGTSGPAVQIADPLSDSGQKDSGGTPIRIPFPGSIVPSTRMNAVAAAIGAYYPKPNVSGITARNSPNLIITPNAEVTDYKAHTVRIDHELTSKHRLSVDLTKSKMALTGGSAYANIVQPFIGQTPDISAAQSQSIGSIRASLGATATLTSVLSPTFIATTRVNWNGHTWKYLDNEFDTTSLGIPASQVAKAQYPTFPDVSVAGYMPIGPPAGLKNTGSIWSVSETLAKTVRSHSLKVGFEGRDLLNNLRTFPIFLNVGFSVNFTQQSASVPSSSYGDSFASFLLGYPSSVSTSYAPQFAHGQKYYVVFLQDDWRVTKRLTLNFGIRWDYESPVTERYNRQVAGFDPSLTQTVGSTTFTGGLVFASPSNRIGFKRDFNNVQPRVGLAYQVGTKLVFRGGWGINYMPTAADVPPSPGFAATTTPSTSVGNTGITPVTLPGCTGSNCGLLTSPFIGGIVAPTNTPSPFVNLGQAISYYDPNHVVPYIHQFSAGFQYQLPFRTVVDLSYVGSRTRELGTSRNIDSVTMAQYQRYSAFTAGGTVANPYAGLLPGTSLNSATYSLQQSLQPYPYYSSITENGESIGTGRYDSLQMRWEKRMSAGLTVLFNATWSSQWTHNSYLNSGEDPKGDFVTLLNGGVPRKQYTVGFAYQIPLFKNSRPILRSVLGGWQVAGTGKMLEGSMQTVGAGQTCYYGGLVCVASGGAVVPTGVDPMQNPTSGRLFNTCTLNMTTKNSDGTYGAQQNCDAGQAVSWIMQPTSYIRLNPDKQFPGFRAPMPGQWNLTASKTFRIKERFRTEFRSEFLNAFNTPQYGWADTSASSATFGKIVPGPRSQVNDPRSIQLSLRVAF